VAVEFVLLFALNVGIVAQAFLVFQILLCNAAEQFADLLLRTVPAASGTRSKGSSEDGAGCTVVDAGGRGGSTDCCPKDRLATSSSGMTLRMGRMLYVRLKV
jgi:hypothetical protein